jgi:peptidase M3-like protein
VERFRAQVRDVVVPLATDIHRRQGKKLGIEPLMFWDEGLHDPAGNPKPLGDADWMIDRAGEMFSRLGADMDKFFVQMREGHLMDLKSRDGKGGGGFCEVVPSFGMPFIFANFNGTKQDAMVFTHEMGHAFQCYSSLAQTLWEHVYPTCETCEIHSMGLEFLTWPQMELFFGEDAVRFRTLHLTTSVLFLPYGGGGGSFSASCLREPQGVAGRTSHDVARDGAYVLAVAELGRPGPPGQWTTLAGSAAHLSTAFLLHRLCAGTDGCVAALGVGRARPTGGDGMLHAALSAGRRAGVWRVGEVGWASVAV